VSRGREHVTRPRGLRWERRVIVRRHTASDRNRRGMLLRRSLSGSRGRRPPGGREELECGRLPRAAPEALVFCFPADTKDTKEHASHGAASNTCIEIVTNMPRYLIPPAILGRRLRLHQKYPHHMRPPSPPRATLLCRRVLHRIFTLCRWDPNLSTS
jgi:hypothetical protein